MGFSTMAFTARILSWRFRHLNIIGCMLKRRPTKGGSRAPQDRPPPLTTPLSFGLGCAIRNTAQAVRSSTNNWNPESKLPGM